jgi:uncharacterized membrane protein
VSRKSRRKQQREFQRQQLAQKPRELEKGIAQQGVFPFPAQDRTYTEYLEHFQGPYPPPQMLEQYDQVHPGLAEEIVSGVREQRQHRIKLEDRVTKHNIIQGYIGQGSALIVTIFALYLSFQLVLMGFDVGGFVLGFSALATLAAVFFIGKRQQRQDLDKKANGSKKS